jgi:hypothetical protein
LRFIRTPWFQVAGTGFESPPENTRNNEIPSQSGAKSGARGARPPHLADPTAPWQTLAGAAELAELARRWPGLPLDARQAILAIARGAKPRSKNK